MIADTGPRSVGAGVRAGGQIMADALRAYGIDAVFCVPGESYLGLLDALYDHRDAIRVVTCRHEHGAAHMADAYGKLTGRPGICLVTRGPGACNASIGVHTAFQDSTPMLLVVGQAARAHIGREAFQEVDFEAMFRPLAKRAMTVERAADMPEAIAEALHAAMSGRRGPVVLSVPEDVFAETSDVPDLAPRPIERRMPDPGHMERLHHLLHDAARPLMLLGGSGWTDEARRDIVAFAAANALPACCSFRRHDILDNDHPAFVGEMGIGADPALIARAQAADLLLVVGARLGEMTSQRYTLIDPDRSAQILAHVHPDAAELGRVFPPALGIAADVAPFAAAARTLAPAGVPRWHDWSVKARADYEANRALPDCPGAVDLGRAMMDLDARLPADAVITVDAGNFSGWPQRFLRFGGGRRLLGATNGAMGYGVPAAVAAKVAQPDRVVVACVGDGGFGMTGQELATAVALDAPIVVLVFDNGMYGTIRLHQERHYPGRAIGTDLGGPDFAAVARACGAFGETVNNTKAFMPALELALAAGRPALLHLRVDPEAITTRTTLSAVRAAAQQQR